MFSAYDPETVELVDQVMPKTKQNTHSEHHGHWRKYSFGMYVIAGSDAAKLSMNENFVGWYVFCVDGQYKERLCLFMCFNMYRLRSRAFLRHQRVTKKRQNDQFLTNRNTLL